MQLGLRILCGLDAEVAFVRRFGVARDERDEQRTAADVLLDHRVPIDTTTELALVEPHVDACTFECGGRGADLREVFTRVHDPVGFRNAVQYASARPAAVE